MLYIIIYRLYFVLFPDVVSPFVVAFDEIIDGPIKQFMNCSEKIGEEVKIQVSYIDISLLP